MTYRVSEIYRAIQGEGWHAGLPCTLVRLQGCNLKPFCSFCDTPYAQDPEGGTEMTSAEVVSRVHELHRRGDIILITGGEPTLQDLGSLVAELGGLGPIHIETNGTLPAQLEVASERAAWITISPKPGALVHPDALRCASEIKWLVGEQSDVEALRSFLSRTSYLMERYKYVSVQPISQDPVATEIAYDTCLEHGWRLSLQLHKYIGVK